ncbi:MAG TPA: alpha/beta hydrolase [Prolixibacteraceae bacterium]
MKSIKSIFLLFFSFQLLAQQTIPLYSTGIPNSTVYPMKEIKMVDQGTFYGYRSIAVPTMAVYLPDQKSATGAAVIICPGGGYAMESYVYEGTMIAEEFQKHGIAAFILKYRLPSDSIMSDKSIGPLQDAQQAIKTVRHRAAEWKINPSKIGIMGFSAGGHLASTAGTHFEESVIPNDEKISLRPDFMILVYPVISMKDGLTHSGSRTNLLGEKPTTNQIEFFSNELHINSTTPPTWLTHTGDDNVVPVENSIRFYQELIRNKVPAEMHLYPKGNHGFVLSQKPEEWMQSVFDWMKKGDIH